MKRILIILLLLPIFARASFDTDKINEGVRDFLIDRANANALYSFEKRLLTKNQLKCLLPNTYSTLKIMTSTGIFGSQLSNKQIWKEKINEDLKLLPYTLALYSIRAIKNNKVDFCSETAQNKVPKTESEALAIELIEANTTEAKVKILEKLFILNLFEGVKAEIKTAAVKLNTADYSLDVITEAIDEINTQISNKIQQGGKPTEPAIIKLKGQLLKIKQVEQFFEDANKYREVVRARFIDTEIDSNQQKIEKAYDNLLTKKQKFDKAIPDLEDLLNEINKLKENKKLTSKIIDIVTKISKLEEFKNLEIGLLDDRRFQKTIRLVTFFTEIADADDSAAVKVILTSYTLPAVSYYAKRDAGWHLMLTSYVGANIQFDSSDFTELEGYENTKLNIFAPIGVELSTGWTNRWYSDSISLMVSPVDFGYPIGQKINGIEESIDFDDIIAPSITLSSGAHDLPITYGFGYQVGAKVQGLKQTETRWFVFIAFDMPLWKIF